MRLLSRSQWLYAALTVLMLPMYVAAQDVNLPDAASISAAAADASASLNDATTTEDPGPASQTGLDSSSDAASTASIPRTETDNGPASTASSSSLIPAITDPSSSAAGIIGGALPTISGVYSIVAPSVPPTADAPFMQESSLPEGTVFIAVGAILGFLGMSVLLWRTIVAWSLHRNVNRITLHQAAVSDNKLAPPAPFYSQYRDQDSTPSLGGSGNKKEKKGIRSPNIGRPSTSSLFFSPTAAGASITQPGSRSSNYLPSGYYASGNAVVGSNSSSTHINTPAINLSNLHPDANHDSQRYSRATSWAPSLPDSTGYRYSAAMKSSSTLNLSLPPGDNRTPSVCLDHLLDSEGGVLAMGVLSGHERRGSSNLRPDSVGRPSTGRDGGRSGLRPGTAGSSVRI